MYDQQILQILNNVGRRGISVHLLAKHVYNMNCTLFYQPDIQDVIRQTRNFVVRKSSGRKPWLEKTERWGFYRLNSRGQGMARQMLATNQSADGEGQTDEKPPQDLSLSLFEEF
jgi:hypothetical protein